MPNKWMAIDHRTIMSGQRRGPAAMMLRAVLRCASVPYGIAVRRRNRGYDSGKAEIHHAGVPVISVGNLTTGGTGKTPIVCYLAKLLREENLRVSIVSRGYGRGEADQNDEAAELAERLPDVPHVQDPDRVAAARIAVEELESEVILMDDGFQHRRLHRDLDIVVIDMTCPFGFDALLPRGLLREPVTGLRRAGMVMLSRCDQVDAGDIDRVLTVIRQHAPDVAVIRTQHRPECMLEYPSETLPLSELIDCPVALISAIGNPMAFERTVQSCGARIVASKQLPDHDPYSPECVAELDRWLRSLDGVAKVLCTHKDLVKLQTDRLGGLPLSAMLIGLSVDQPELVRDTVMQVICRRSAAE
ncbi:tetraacyldisaccharide 4'-kinase [Stieleria varia]|uniref:Tetraacyldisaccharide 4'-kinase n=1 Tax=Stieleria varia TaxID=2528005 RepID=A0A5C6B1V7_9BACT|nr:tetraacyldisaccharide 4'-kinase [Stieleria varia]TWU05888.1 Tetraacyldisaccharide 4'-kinase [Stieleria varia]